VILDEFTMGCLAPECEMLTFRPDNWLQKLDPHRPGALFVESAWRGNEGAWLYRVAKYPRNMGNELAELLQWAKQHDIPSVFWNKEDPVHFERFIERAKLFSHVFTTDADCIPRYREQVGHDRVFALPFAAQPVIHNPIHDSPRTGAVCFAGTYYGNRHEQRQVDMDYVLRPAIPFGLEIYDRQYGLSGKGADAYRFPDIYQSSIKGRLDYEDMVRAYRNYRVFLNVNSVKQSPTMFSRRVFELLACGTPVVSTYSRGIVDLLGEDVVFITESEADTRRHLDRLLGDEEAWARASTRGIRKVMQSHTYQHRLDEVFNHTGMQLLPRTEPGFSVVLSVTSDDDLQCLAPMLTSQTYRRFDVVLISAKALSGDALQSFQNALGNVQLTPCVGPLEGQFEPCLQASHSDYLAFLDLADLYGPDYLMDCALAITYSGANFLGKHTHFEQRKGDRHLCQPGGEYRWVTDVPSSSLVARKTAIVQKDFVRALQTPSFQRQHGPVLSIDRFNYLRHDMKGPGSVEKPSDMRRQLQEVSA
jgi:spore maturation protein CgeB